MPGTSRLVVLGVITSPHGVRGEVKIRTFTENPKNLTAYGMLQDKHGQTYKVKISGGTGEMLIALIEGITDRNQAEKLRNIELCVPRTALPKPAKNTYYHEDLIGIKVHEENGAEFGLIAAVHNYGAGDILLIKLTSGEEELFPLNKETFPEIDVDAGTAIIIPPEMIGE